MNVSEQTWDRLHDAAVEAMRHAYCPYSHFSVGAAGLAEDGRIVTGCNVENASLGVTLCAECGMISELVKTGGGRLVAFACVDQDGHACSPCGRCRQLLYEHGGSSLQMAMSGGITTLAAYLPDAFGPENLEEKKHTCK